MPAGQIIDQYPKKDKSAKENTAVDLFVAKKKTETTKTAEEVGDTENNNHKDAKENVVKEEQKKEKTKPADDKTKDTKDIGTDKTKEKTNGEKTNGKRT